MNEQSLSETTFPLNSSDVEEHNMKNPPSNNNVSKQVFAELLLNAVDESLSKLEGSSPQVIYALLEKTFHLHRSEIPRRTEEFQEALEHIFGYTAKLVEIQIIEHLNRKIGPVSNYPSEIGDLLLSEYIRVARSTISE